MPEPGGRRWRVTNSFWILPTFCLGFLTWCSFLYIGARTGRRAWLVTAVVYLAVIVGVMVALEFSGPTEAEVAAGAPPATAGQKAIGMWASGAALANWIAGIVHALLVRPQYLRLRWNRSAGAHPPLTPAYPHQVPPPGGWIGDVAQQYWVPPRPPGGFAGHAPFAGQAPGGGSPVAAPWQGGVGASYGPGHPPAFSGAGDPPMSDGWPSDRGSAVVPPVAMADDQTRPSFAAAAFSLSKPGARTRSDGTGLDVNAASAGQLAELGMPAAAVTAVLDARARTGPLQDLRQFAEVTALKPHQIHRFAARLEFRVPAPPVLGRKLDL